MCRGLLGRLSGDGKRNCRFRTGPDRKTTLVWAVWDTGQLPFVQDVIDAYEAEHPDIEIRVEEYPTDGYDFSLESDLMSEDHQIDCMLIKDIPGYLSLAKKQLILPVEETDFSDSGIQKT